MVSCLQTGGLALNEKHVYNVKVRELVNHRGRSLTFC